MIRFCAIFLFAVIAGTAVADPQKIVADAADRINTARQALQIAQEERDQVKAYAKVVQAYDIALLASRAGVTELARAEQAATIAANQARENLAASAVALMKLETVPPILRTQHPGGPADAAVARRLLVSLQDQMAGQYREDIAALTQYATLRALHEAARDDLEAALNDARTARAGLLAATEQRAQPSDLARNAQVQKLADAAQSLEDLARVLPNLRYQVDGIRGALTRGGLGWPIDGDVVAQFENADPNGLVRPGLVVTGSPRSLVIAPQAAQVAFAGPFLDHGKVVVLRIGNDALLALNGLGDAIVRTGMVVEKGQPLGFMGGQNTVDEEFLITQSRHEGAFRSEPLYIELRLDGIATDPVPFFEARAGQER